MGQNQDTKGPEVDAASRQPSKLPCIGIMGGTFDPVHMGHLLAAEQCREQLKLDEVRFVPAFVSPFKLEKRSADPKQRMDMLHLATQGNPSFRVDDRELKRGGTSFTVDTLRELKSELPQTKLIFLMGADSLAEFDRWREPAEICRLARVVVVARGGEPAPDLQMLSRFLPAGSEAGQHLIAMPQCEISSSRIRQAVADGRSIRYQVPAAVAAYIQQNKLYEVPSGTAP